MAGTGGEDRASSSTAGFDTSPPEGFTGGGYGGGYDPLPPGYGWAPPGAPLPPGWRVDQGTRQLLAPGEQPSGEVPEGLLPGYSWIGPGTVLPEGWHIDPETDVLIPPSDPAQPVPKREGERQASPRPADTSEGGPEAPWPQTGPAGV